MPALNGKIMAVKNNRINKPMTITLPNNRPLDAICLGRAGVDLYAREHDTDFQDVTSFEKHVGGSPANIAIGMAILGSKVAVSSVVSDDVLGHYVIANLQSHGINTSPIRIDNSGSRTSLAITEVKPDNCHVVIYRNNASDLTLCDADIATALIEDSKMLVVSGTALSQEPSRAASLLAMQTSRNHGTCGILDIDYRPYSWGTETQASLYYQKAAANCDIIIGNREEFTVMFGENFNRENDISDRCFALGVSQLVIIKDGENGSVLISKDGKQHQQAIFPVKVLKPFGAGDAFAAAFCVSLINGLTIPVSAENGAAAAAMVVAKNSCGDATPTQQELELFIQQSKNQ